MCHDGLQAEGEHPRTARHTRKLKAWLRLGKIVELRDRGELIARIVPAKKKRRRAVKLPDFAARARKIFGHRILAGADIVIEERGRY